MNYYLVDLEVRGSFFIEGSSNPYYTKERLRERYIILHSSFELALATGRALHRNLIGRANLLGTVETKTAPFVAAATKEQVVEAKILLADEYDDFLRHFAKAL